MGSSQSHILPVDQDQAKAILADVRQKHGANVLLMSVKDQNMPGKLSLSGPATPELEKELTDILKADKNNTSVIQESDKYDTMYDVTWRNTSLTTGHSTFSLAKSYFPRGTLLVKILDLLAKHGWTLSASPNFGGVESRNERGNVTSCLDWPVFVFYKDKGSSMYDPSHLFLAVKDSNMPGKLCAAGPVGALEASMASKLQEFAPDVLSEKDSYDEDYDVVWRNTSITSGMAAMSFAKAYFPKGNVNVGLLERAYAHGWRVLACPNFGGAGDSWPCYILRMLKDSSEPAPDLIVGAIKDSNIPGKLCLSGKDATAVAQKVADALKACAGNQDVTLEKDSYDDDHDAVVRNVNITTGMAAFSLKLPYFPRCDSMMAMLNAMQADGYTMVGCPNFGGMHASWPTFIWEKSPHPSIPMFMAVKDDNIPGKLNLGGGGIGADATLASELLEVLKALCGPEVVQQRDDYDSTFDLSFKNTRITTGHSAFTFTKAYYPHGYVVEAVLAILYSHGWEAVGGPNFGDDGNTWPCIVFKKITSFIE